MELDLGGYAVGGLSLGESKRETDAMLDAATAGLPGGRPPVVMGRGARGGVKTGGGYGDGARSPWNCAGHADKRAA